jgi:hypothetical protein
MAELAQALHGYDRGHRLLAVGGDVNAAERNLMERLSDLSGYTPIDFGFDHYHTGYTCGRYYALACTWPDEDADRGGAVLTHTLLLPLEEAALQPTLGPLLGLHRRPASATDRAPYQVPLTSPLDPEIVQPVARPRATAALALLFGQPHRPILWIESPPPDDIVRLLWSYLWPEARREFSFCTLSFQPRQIEGRVFSFLGAPPECRGAFPSRATTRAWWDQGQAGDPAGVDTNAHPWLAGLLDGGPVGLQEALQPLRDAGLPLPPPSELPRLLRLSELRQAAPERLAAARASADLLARLWPDLSAHHPWWAEALDHILQRQADAPLTPRPLWDLLDLLQRPQARARMDDEPFRDRLAIVLHREVMRRLQEAPNESAVGLGLLSNAARATVAAKPLLAALTQATTDAIARAPKPSQALMIATSVIRAPEAAGVPSTLQAAALRQLPPDQRAQLLQDLPPAPHWMQLAREMHEPQLLFDLWRRAGDPARGLEEAAALIWQSDLPRLALLQNVVALAPPEIVLRWAVGVTDPRIAHAAADQAAARLHTTRPDLERLAEACDGKPNGAQVYAAAGGSAALSEVQSSLAARPDLSLAILQATAGSHPHPALQRVSLAAVASLSEDRLVQSELPTLLGSTVALPWFQKLAERATEIVLRRLMAGQIEPRVAGAWFVAEPLRTDLTHKASWELDRILTLSSTKALSLLTATVRAACEGRPPVTWALNLLVFALQRTPLPGLQPAVDDLVWLLERSQGQDHIRLAGEILGAVRRHVPKDGWRLVETTFSIVYPLLEEGRPSFWSWYYWLDPVWDKARPWRLWLLDTWLVQRWPVDALLRLLDRMKDGERLLERLAKRAWKVNGGPELLSHMLNAATETPSLSGRWGPALRTSLRRGPQPYDWD